MLPNYSKKRPTNYQELLKNAEEIFWTVKFEKIVS
jgi:hypothetical protein